jgi:hypothetical protein
MGAAFAWRSTVAHHALTSMDDGRTLVRQAVDQRGLVGAIVGRLMLRTTRRYLEMEAQGLKVRSEQLRRLDGSLS